MNFQPNFVKLTRRGEYEVSDGTPRFRCPLGPMSLPREMGDQRPTCAIVHFSPRSLIQGLSLDALCVCFSQKQLRPASLASWLKDQHRTHHPAQDRGSPQPPPPPSLPALEGREINGEPFVSVGKGEGGAQPGPKGPPPHLAQESQRWGAL